MNSNLKKSKSFMYSTFFNFTIAVAGTNKVTLLLASCAAYFAPLTNILAILFIFLVLDFITGMYASFRRKVKIESNKLRKTVEKFVLYSVAILAGYMFQHEFAASINIVQVIGGFVAAVELYSIYENISKITGLQLDKKLKSLLGNFISGIINKKK